MRTLGLDIGTKRIGLAISDETGTFAFPEGKLERRGKRVDLEALRSLVEERGILRIVMGLPIHMDGRKGKGVDAALRFARALSEVTGLTVDTIDERLTTVEAERVLQASGHNSKKQRGKVDSVAASIILSTYLEAEKNRLEREKNETSPGEAL
jgi:putative Holliday junction resolvase